MSGWKKGLIGGWIVSIVGMVVVLLWMFTEEDEVRKSRDVGEKTVVLEDKKIEVKRLEGSFVEGVQLDSEKGNFEYVRQEMEKLGLEVAKGE